MSKTAWWSDPEKKAAAVEKMKVRARNRWPSKLSKYGITEEIYRREIEAGNKWCTGHKRFEPLSEFSDAQKPWPCLEFNRDKCKSRWQKLPWEERSRIAKEQYKKHGTPDERRKRLLWHMYRLTPERWQEILDSQGGVCAICHKSPEDNGPHRFAVDHSHKCCKGRRSCGKCIRGLLCQSCNYMLGFVELKSWNEKATAYLKLYD